MHGIKITASNGKVVLDTSTITWNVLATFYCDAYESKSVSIPLLMQMQQHCYQVHFVNKPPDNQEAILPQVVITSNSVSAFSGNVKAIVVVLGR